jgi:hypothetical protein
MFCSNVSRTLGDIRAFAEIARVSAELGTDTEPVAVGSARGTCSRAVIASGNVVAARGDAASAVTFGVKLRLFTGSNVTRAFQRRLNDRIGDRV